MARLPVVPVPAGFKVRPVEEREVAARLAELAAGPAAGRVADISGPEVSSYAQMLRAYLDVRHRHRPVIEVPAPGTAAIRGGALLLDEHGTPTPVIGRRTWAEFLVERVKRHA